MSSIETLHRELWPVECPCFFRKWWLSAGRTAECMLEEEYMENYCERPESGVADECAQSCGCFLVSCCCPLPLWCTNPHSYSGHHETRLGAAQPAWMYGSHSLLFMRIPFVICCRGASGRNTCGRAVHLEGWRRWSGESTLSTWLCHCCWLCSSSPPSPSPCGAATLASARSVAPAWDTRITTTSCRWSLWTIGGGITTTVINQNSASTAAQLIQALRSHQGEEVPETHRRLMRRPWATRTFK